MKIYMELQKESLFKKSLTTMTFGQRLMVSFYMGSLHHLYDKPFLRDIGAVIFRVLWCCAGLTELVANYPLRNDPSKIA